MIQARLRRVVDGLLDLRIRLVEGDLVPWGRLIAPKQQTTEELFGHLVALPSEEPPKASLQEMVSDDDAKAELSARMQTYFHRLRIQHPFTRDVTVLCGWWRLDAVNSPNYDDFRQAAMGDDATQKQSEIRLSDEFLARTKTFDMSGATRDFAGLDDRKGSYARAAALAGEDFKLALLYATAQRRMLRDMDVTSLVSKYDSGNIAHMTLMSAINKQGEHTEPQHSSQSHSTS